VNFAGVSAQSFISAAWFCCRIGLVAAKAVSKHKLKETYQKELQLGTP
jgi:hypothetical protein